MELGKQQAIIKQLELPCAALVYSGGKSVHAIVKVDAPDYAEYRRRVDYLYSACQKNGLTIDQQNRNPSRLSRMPGILRGDKRQVLLETNIGKSCWDEWRDWLEAETDELPETESLADDWESLPPAGRCPHHRGAAQGPQDAAGRPQQGGQELCPHRAVHRYRRRHALAGPVLLHTGQGTVHQSGAGPGLLPAPLQGRVHCPRPAPAEPAKHRHLEPARRVRAHGQAGPKAHPPGPEKRLHRRDPRPHL